MNSSQKIIAFAILVIISVSCKTNKFAFLDSYPTIQLPLIDSTSFSNHLEGKSLTKQEQKNLDLRTVFGEQLDNDKAKVGVSYLPKISENFTSVVYYFYSSNTELISMLVNYDENYKVINSQMVAYDEISDNLLHSISTIYTDKIVLKEFISENASIIKFDILKDGNITRE